MPRVAGVDLPNKPIEIALTYIYGIGRPRALTILKKAGVQIGLRANDLTEKDLAGIRRALEEYRLEGELRAETAQNIKRLVELNCYRGQRHRNGLPVRGQRTKTNARTRKGKAKTVANKKIAVKK